MEGKTVRSIVIFTSFLGVLVGESAGGIAGCLCDCLLQCIQSGTPLDACPAICIKGCLLNQATILGTSHTNTHLCKIGCAVTKCSKLNPNADSVVKELDTYVNACLESCQKN
ncbi:thionin-like protein 2 [Quillaja saponaria]|uniref:Thionin-like protein 2 n=1 Tax=Quillaja saponaria TaxID=32244 RepID=A0AAD7M4H7_QUISA|nr:thionin-like protein 2 [Quillaja saponaria]